MDGGDLWRVADLLDQERQPFVEDVMLARQMAETLHSLRGTSLNVRVPRAAEEFVENTLSEWFETVADIEKRRGNMPYLIDRSLYPSGEIDWNQGLTKTDLDSWLSLTYGYGLGDEYYYRKPVKPSEEPLSGYYNRLLPVKFVLRMLVALTVNREGFDKEEGWDITIDDDVTLSELRESSWLSASYAKETLQLYDQLSEAKGKTGAKLSVGFPTKDEKSKERFVSQFVGSRRKKELSGALFDMGFAGISGIGSIFDSIGGFTNEDIGFTQFGLQFTMLENPVIDEIEGWQEEGVFSKKEVDFLLAHFKQNVPAEWKFMVSIAEMIHDGTNDATKMNAALISQRDWKKSKASVYRTGVLARMQELGLVYREKSGVQVTFVLTESGKDKLL
jgi:hypothetical protein